MPLDLEKSLSYNYLFRGLPPEALHEVAMLAEVKKFLGGDLMVRQFDASTDLYVLVDGNAISRTFSGEVVARFGPGSVIGEIAFIDGEKRSANVTSAGDSTAIRIPSAVLWALMDRNKQVGYTVLKNLATVLCRRLRSMNDLADSGASVGKR